MHGMFVPEQCLGSYHVGHCALKEQLKAHMGRLHRLVWMLQQNSTKGGACAMAASRHFASDDVQLLALGAMHCWWAAWSLFAVATQADHLKSC